jgi:hypothetical protein
MKTIWKYPIPIESTFEIGMPKGAIILTVQIENEVPTFWATVDTQEQAEVRHFALIGTGEPLPGRWEEGMTYIGTFEHYPYVWHLFEELELEEE